jgi:single-strand DNA-binding protein
MNSVNQTFLLGASGKDPEIRATGGGTLIASFSLATSEGRKDAQGNWKDETTWHNVKAFGRLAEITREHVKKGSKVFVEGRITTESWDDKTTGQKRYKTVIVANHLAVSLVPSGRSNEAKEPAASQYDRAIKGTEISDDDIPF